MARLYNQKTVARNSVSTGDQTFQSFRYKGFSSANKKEKFKLYDIDLVKQDLINNFYIRKGEKLENPEFGTIIWDMLFEQFTENVKQNIAEDVEEIINYDPRIQVRSVTVDSTQDGIRIEADLTYIPFDISERLTLNFDRENGLIN